VAEGLNLIFQVVVPLVLIALGFVVGHLIERRHLRSIRRREAAGGPTLTNLVKPPDGRTVQEAWLCTGSVVIASDYFKTFGARLKTLIGGRLRTLETLVDRARREAVLRLRQQAAEHGADMVLNVRLGMSIIMRPCAEVIAYGTAVKFARDRNDDGQQQL